MFDRLSAEFGLHQSALALRQQRQEVLAANIANADTPHYKARDLDFRQQMSQAIQTQEQSQGTRLSLTSPRHIPGGQMTSISSELKYRIPAQPSLDGNTVDMDAERVAFADNSMGYQSSLSILSNVLKRLALHCSPEDRSE